MGSLGPTFSVPSGKWVDRTLQCGDVGRPAVCRGAPIAHSATKWRWASRCARRRPRPDLSTPLYSIGESELNPDPEDSDVGRPFGSSPLVIAEVAQAHDGSLGSAHAYIDAVAEAGADAVKFQTHIASEESTPSEPWRVRFSPQDETRYEYWRRMEFSADQWRGLSRHAQDRNLLFLSTPFSFAAVDLLRDLEMPIWKVASGELLNLPLIEYMAEGGEPMILSSGMASWAHLDAAVEVIRSLGVPFATLQCTSTYPCPPEAVGLNVLSEMRQRYMCPVGLSDHSGSIYSPLAAVSLGASIVETHVVFSRHCYGPDASSSITVDELATLTEGARFIASALSSPVDKDAMAESMSEMRAIFGKSIVTAHALPARHALETRDIAFKKPGSGLPPNYAPHILGRVLRRSLPADAQLREEDLE